MQLFDQMVRHVLSRRHARFGNAGRRVV
jgi:hypothetical protein